MQPGHSPSPTCRGSTSPGRRRSKFYPWVHADLLPSPTDFSCPSHSENPPEPSSVAHEPCHLQFHLNATPFTHPLSLPIISMSHSLEAALTLDEQGAPQMGPLLLQPVVYLFVAACHQVTENCPLPLVFLTRIPAHGDVPAVVHFC